MTDADASEARGETGSPDAPRGGPGRFAALRDAHHSLAREAALGRSLGALAALSGLNPARVATLARSPAFRQLVAHYRRTA
jgi:hypothetical protein